MQQMPLFDARGKAARCRRNAAESNPDIAEISADDSGS
jgi:hypothetical protein